MAKPELGSKRVCHSCSTKFFDLNKDPVLCPKCGTLFVAASLARAAAPVAAAKDEDAEADPMAAVLVPLEEADGDKAPVASGDDAEVEDDPAADDTFLEEEEEDDDDVAGLIDGDLETDEEA